MAQNRSKSISFGFHFPGCGFRGKSNSLSLTPSSLPKPEKVKGKGKSLRRVRLFATPWTPTTLLRPWDFPSKNTGVGCHRLLQTIFLTQGSNPGLLHCRQTLYCLSYQGSHQFAVSGDLTHTHTYDKIETLLMESLLTDIQQVVFQLLHSSLESCRGNLIRKQVFPPVLALSWVH